MPYLTDVIQRRIRPAVCKLPVRPDDVDRPFRQLDHRVRRGSTPIGITPDSVITLYRIP